MTLVLNPDGDRHMGLGERGEQEMVREIVSGTILAVDTRCGSPATSLSDP